MHFLSGVVPVEVHAKVVLSLPVGSAFVVFVENGSEMFSMLAMNILDAKIVHIE